MTVRELIETNANMGSGTIRLFNGYNGHCSFNGEYSETNDYIKNKKVKAWSFETQKQLNILQWIFRLDITIE